MRFLLVDRIESLTAGQHIVAARTFPPDDDYLADHFPGFPVVPGVLLTESMGQAAAKCLDAQHRSRGKAMLVRILSASFRQWVKPGELLELQAAIVADEERFATADCKASVAGRPVAQAKLLFSFVPWDSFAAGFTDRVLDDFMAGSAR